MATTGKQHTSPLFLCLRHHARCEGFIKKIPFNAFNTLDYKNIPRYCQFGIQSSHSPGFQFKTLYYVGINYGLTPVVPLSITVYTNP